MLYNIKKIFDYIRKNIYLCTVKQEIKKYLESETIKNQQEIQNNVFYLRMVKLMIFIIIDVLIGAIISLLFI